MKDKIIELIHVRNQALSKNDCISIYNALDELCQRNGFNIEKLSYIGGFWESALVFQIEDKIIKVCPSMDRNIGVQEYIKNTNQILQIDDSIDVTVLFNNRFRMIMSVVIQKKLNMDKKPTDEELTYLLARLKNDGYVTLDIKDDNFGFDEEKQEYKLIDYGQLYNKKYDQYYIEHLKYFNDEMEKRYYKKKGRRF